MWRGPEGLTVKGPVLALGRPAVRELKRNKEHKKCVKRLDYVDLRVEQVNVNRK